MATLAVGWIAPVVGLCVAISLSIATFYAYERSMGVKGTADRAAHRHDVIQMGICVVLAGVPSLWFMAVGRRHATRSAGSTSGLNHPAI